MYVLYSSTKYCNKCGYDIRFFELMSKPICQIAMKTIDTDSSFCSSSTLRIILNVV